MSDSQKVEEPKRNIDMASRWLARFYHKPNQPRSGEIFVAKRHSP